MTTNVRFRMSMGKDKINNIIRYFNSYIKLKRAEIKNMKAKKFRMLVENEPNCSIITYPYYFIKWRFA